MTDRLADDQHKEHAAPSTPPTRTATTNPLPGPGPLDDDRAWLDETVIPALLRSARRSYGGAIRDALAEAGCPDIPRNGAYLIGAISRNGSPLSEIIDGLGVSKQTAGQLVDTLVLRGYLDRAPDPLDRRRMNVSLTERGQLASEAIQAAVEEVDAELEQRVGAEAIDHTRRVLWTLNRIAAELSAARNPGASHSHGHGHGPDHE